jgi:hypothetical protein
VEDVRISKGSIWANKGEKTPYGEVLRTRGKRVRLHHFRTDTKFWCKRKTFLEQLEPLEAEENGSEVRK